MKIQRDNFKIEQTRNYLNLSGCTSLSLLATRTSSAAITASDITENYVLIHVETLKIKKKKHFLFLE